MAWGCVLAVFAWGWVADHHHVFPFALVDGMLRDIKPLVLELTGRLPDAFVRAPRKETVVLRRPAETSPGMTLIAGVGPGGRLMAKLVEMDGAVEHAWDLDWFRIWPDRRNVPADTLPKSRPGADIHGVVLSPNGDLTFSYENLGMVQVDFCGRVKWRLARMTHHAIYRDDAGRFWTLDHLIHDRTDARFPTFKPPFYEDEVVELSPQGRVLRTFSVPELLKQNGYEGLLYMSSIDNKSTAPCCDFLHTNDVEVFPGRMKEDLFRHGDVMVSVRNINTVFVFDPETRRIKRLLIGQFVRQHDPDFVDGSTISVFDNHNVGLDAPEAASRIVVFSLKTGAERVLFQGTPAEPFYTQVMGKQQWLDNGDVLLAERTHGRALEVNQKGQVVWEYYNHIGKGLLGVVNAAQRIAPARLTVDQVRAMSRACAAPARAGG